MLIKYLITIFVEKFYMTKNYTHHTNIIPSGTAWAVMGSEAMSSLYDLRWMIFAVILLIGADAYNGTRESFMRFDKAKSIGDKVGMEKYRFHLSRFWRRTICKLIEYLTYLLIGCVLGLAIFEPCGVCNHVISAAIGLIIGALCEVSSILGHLLILHHIVLPRLTWKNASAFIGQVVAIFIKKKNTELGEAVEETVNNTFNEENSNENNK